jgi:hypothetical protein
MNHVIGGDTPEFLLLMKSFTDSLVFGRYDVEGNEIGAREPKKDAAVKRGSADFEYDADGNEIEERGTADCEYPLSQSIVPRDVPPVVYPHPGLS